MFTHNLKKKKWLRECKNKTATGMHYETVGTKIANMLPEKLLNLKFDNFNKRITQWLTIDFKKLRIITYNTIVQLYRVKKNKIDNKYDCCLLLKKIKVYFQRIFFF